MFDRYRWAGGEEAALRLGPDRGPTVLVSPALFEEANRTRAFTVAVMRALAEYGIGIGSLLPDLPGIGESMVATVDARLENWRAALAASSGDRPVVVFAVRGGSLIDGEVTAVGRYQLAPVEGDSLVRDLVRSARVAGRTPDVTRPAVDLAGNLIARELLDALSEAEPTPGARVIRLASDPRPADLKLPGRPLWRGSEPDSDAVLARAVAADLAEYARACAG